MRSLGTISLVFLALLAGCDNQTGTDSGRSAKPQSRHAVTLSEADIVRLGIKTTPAQATKYTPHVHGYGVVVNTTALAQLDAAIVTATAAQRQSQAAVKRARTLFGKTQTVHAVSHEALDAAEQRAAADEAALALADSTEVAAFGQHAPWRGKNRNSEILAKLTSGRTMLVEATFPLGVKLGALPSALTVTHLTTQPGQAGRAASKIWNAPADPTIPGRSFFALVDGADLAQGEHVLVFAPTGKPIDGVRVPVEAIVLSEDKTWCYAATSPRTFVRLPIDLGTPITDGYFVAHGINPSQPIVVAGTGLLLARETGAAPAGQY